MTELNFGHFTQKLREINVFNTKLHNSTVSYFQKRVFFSSPHYLLKIVKKPKLWVWCLSFPIMMWSLTLNMRSLFAVLQPPINQISCFHSTAKAHPEENPPGISVFPGSHFVEFLSARSMRALIHLAFLFYYYFERKRYS